MHEVIAKWTETSQLSVFRLVQNVSKRNSINGNFKICACNDELESTEWIIILQFATDHNFITILPKKILQINN